MSKIIDSYSESNSNVDRYYYNNGANWYATQGQTFYNKYECTLDKCQFYIEKAGSPTGNIYAIITAHTGNYSVDGVGTATATGMGIANISGQLATSDAVDQSTLPSSVALVDFSFSGAEKITLQADTYYYVGIVADNNSISNSFTFGIDTDAPLAFGNNAYLIAYPDEGGPYSWTAVNSVDICFYVYRDEDIEEDESSKVFTNSNLDLAFCYSQGTQLCYSSANIRMGYRDGENYGDVYAGFRFNNVTIPQGATITYAIFKYIAYDTDASTDNVRIFAEDVDDSDAFVLTYSDSDSPAGKTPTTAYIDWTLPNQIDNGWYSSPDIKTVIQEVIDRGGWSSGNSLTILIRNNGATENHNALNGVAYIDIYYTTDSGVSGNFFQIL